VFQVSVKVKASFLAAAGCTNTAAAKTAATKKIKIKIRKQRGGSPFLVHFLAKQKSESRRATAGNDYLEIFLWVECAMVL
jgi:hypothetical protein